MAKKDEDLLEWTQCAACLEGVRKGEAFYNEETMEWVHPECFGIWKCGFCGAWNSVEDPITKEEVRLCDECLEPRHEDAKDSTPSD